LRSPSRVGVGSAVAVRAGASRVGGGDGAADALPEGGLARRARARARIGRPETFDESIREEPKDGSLCMNRRTSGAATVGLIWIIVLILLLIGCAAGLYAVSADKTKAEEAIVAQKKLTEEADGKVKTLKNKLSALSKVVGFRDESDQGDSRDDQIAKAIEDIRTKQNLGADATTTSKVIEKLQTQIEELTRQLAEAKTQQTTEVQARASLQGNLQDVTKAKDEENEKITKQLTDERDRHANQETTDKGRIDDLEKRMKDADARVKAAKDEGDKQIAKLSEEVKTRDARIAELAKRVETIRLPDQPDGSVLDASTASTCYIDIGRKQMLVRGTRFKVFSYAKNGSMHEKGMIEVTKVEDSMAEATVVDLKDKFDPIAKGDKIAAPNYDPKMPREFVLVGRFPSGYSRALVADRLRALGSTVKDKVGPTTDFLVVGDKDEGAAKPEETKEGDAAAAAPSEDEELKLAQLYRVQIVPVRDILDYVKYE
jgi:predicted  nucleic acid-binding Zn-ribbon protein